MIFLYWIATGVTQGLFWSDRKYSAAEFHLWRLVEVIAIVSAVLLYKDFWNFIGMNLIGIFFYERILMKIASDKWFKDEGTIFDIGLKIKRYRWQDFLILAVGIVLCIL